VLDNEQKHTFLCHQLQDFVS